MASRNLLDLHPQLFPLAVSFLNKCRGVGVDILVTCTFRTNAEQNLLYAQGRTAPGEIITNARGGESEHNFTIQGKPAAKALDIVPLDCGRPIWYRQHPLWDKIAQVYYSGIKNDTHYLDWYGKNGSKFYEIFHFCLKEIEK